MKTKNHPKQLVLQSRLSIYLFELPDFQSKSICIMNPIIPLILSLFFVLVCQGQYKNLRASRKGQIQRDSTVNAADPIKCGSRVLIKHIASKKCFTLRQNTSSTITSNSNNNDDKYDRFYVALDTCDIFDIDSHWSIHCCDQYMMRCTGDISNRNIDLTIYPTINNKPNPNYNKHNSNHNSKSDESLYNPIHSEGSKPVKYGNPVPASDITYDTYVQIESKYGRSDARGCISTSIREERRNYTLSTNLNDDDPNSIRYRHVVEWQNGHDHERLIIKQCEGSFFDITDSGYGEQMIQTDKWAFNLWDSTEVVETNHIFRLLNVKFPGCLGSNDDEKNGIHGEFVQGYSCNTGLGRNQNWELRFIPIPIDSIKKIEAAKENKQKSGKHDEL